MKSFLVALMLVIILPAVETEAGIFFRQGRGLFPAARGVVGRSCDRQARQYNRQGYRQSRGYGYYGFRSCSNCNKTRAKAVFVS